MNKALFCVGLWAAIAASGCASETTEESAPEERVSADLASIVGGVQTSAYPAAALLNMKAAGGGLFACTAAVIAPKVVLTAGHCVDGMVRWDVYANGSLRTSTAGETYDFALRVDSPADLRNTSAPNFLYRCRWWPEPGSRLWRDDLDPRQLPTAASGQASR